MDAPFGDGARMIAFLPLSALRMLFAGVAPGLVDGVIAATMPTGRAISVRPRAGSAWITPTDFAPRRSRSRPIVLRRFFAILSATSPSPVSRTAISASARLRRRLDDGPGRGGDHLVHALLRPRLVLALRGTGPRDERGNDGFGRWNGGQAHAGASDLR